MAVYTEQEVARIVAAALEATGLAKQPTKEAAAAPVASPMREVRQHCYDRRMARQADRRSLTNGRGLTKAEKHWLFYTAPAWNMTYAEATAWYKSIDTATQDAEWNASACECGKKTCLATAAR